MGWTTVWMRQRNEQGAEAKESCMPLEKAQREEGALGKVLGVSKGVAEEPDGIWGQVVGVGDKGQQGSS